MDIPRALREQVKFYERHGFHVVDVESRAGAHMKLVFAEFPQPQFVTVSRTDWRGWKNNISNYKRLAQETNDSRNEVPRVRGVD